MKTKVISFVTFIVLIQPLSLGFITPVAHASVPNDDFKIVTGTYIGTGSAQSITGVGFQPKVVIIKGDTTQRAVWRSDSMIGDSTAHLTPFANIAGGVTTLDPLGFTVGTDATVNSFGVSYYYIAFGSSSGDLVTGSYSGDGTDDKSISGLGFQPALVWLKGDAGGIQPVWRSSDHVGDLSSYFADFEDAGNLIQSLEVDGFQIGNDDSVNRCVGVPPCTGTVYHYVAFKPAPEQLKFGTFPGDGNDDRDITIASGFKPDYIWVKAASGFTTPPTRNLKHKPASLPGDSSLTIWAFVNETDRIQALLPDGFQVGADDQVNELTDPAVIYRYVAWRHLPNSPTSLGPLVVTNGSTISNNTPSFQFSLSDPIVSDTVSYRLQIDDSSDFSSPVVDFTSALGTQGIFSFTVGQGVNGGSYTSGSQGQNLSPGSYFWRVLTIDSNSAASTYTSANSGSVAFVVDVNNISQLPNTGANSLYILLPYILISFGLGLKVYAEYLENRYILLPRYKELVLEIRKYLDEKRRY